jgi:hypothetical protein
MIAKVKCPTILNLITKHLFHRKNLDKMVKVKKVKKKKVRKVKVRKVVYLSKMMTLT